LIILFLNKIIIDEIFDTYNHTRVVKTAEKLLKTQNANEIIGIKTLKKLSKL